MLIKRTLRSIFHVPRIAVTIDIEVTGWCCYCCCCKQRRAIDGENHHIVGLRTAPRQTCSIFRQMKILDGYIGRTVLSSTLMTLLILAGISSLFRFIEQLKSVGKGDYDALHAALFTMYSLPTDIEVFFPMAALIGGLIGLGALASHSELIVMQAAGLSRFNIVQSVMKAALVMVVIVMVVVVRAAAAAMAATAAVAADAVMLLAALIHPAGGRGRTRRRRRRPGWRRQPWHRRRGRSACVLDTDASVTSSMRRGRPQPTGRRRGAGR